MNATGAGLVGPIHGSRINVEPYTEDIPFPAFEIFRKSTPPTPYMGAFATPPTRMGVKAEYNARLYNRPAAVPGESTVLAIRTLEGLIIGEIHITLGNTRNRTHYMSWVIDPMFTGHGYATEAANLVINALFAIGVHRIVASIEPENYASAAVAEKAGFLYEGTAVSSLWRDNAWRDVQYWAIHKEEQTNG